MERLEVTPSSCCGSCLDGCGGYGRREDTDEGLKGSCPRVSKVDPRRFLSRISNTPLWGGERTAATCTQPRGDCCLESAFHATLFPSSLLVPNNGPMQLKPTVLREWRCPTPPAFGCVVIALKVAWACLSQMGGSRGFGFSLASYPIHPNAATRESR